MNAKRRAQIAEIIEKSQAIKNLVDELAIEEGHDFKNKIITDTKTIDNLEGACGDLENVIEQLQAAME